VGCLSTASKESKGKLENGSIFPETGSPRGYQALASIILTGTGKPTFWGRWDCRRKERWGTAAPGLQAQTEFPTTLGVGILSLHDAIQNRIRFEQSGKIRSGSSSPAAEKNRIFLFSGRPNI